MSYLSLCHSICLLVSLLHLSSFCLSVCPPEWINHQVRWFRGLRVKCGNNIRSWLIHCTPPAVGVQHYRRAVLQSNRVIKHSKSQSCTVSAATVKIPTVTLSFLELESMKTNLMDFANLLLTLFNFSKLFLSNEMCYPSLLEHCQIWKAWKWNQFKLYKNKKSVCFVIPCAD